MVLRAQGVGGLWLYYYPLPEVPVRWGGCSRKGNLSFNCLPVLTPPEVIDSVVPHELRVFPEHCTWHRWLQKNDPTLLLSTRAREE